MDFILVALVLSVVSALYCYKKIFGVVTLYQFHKGLLYKNGSFEKILTAGKYHYIKASTLIKIIDIRMMMILLSGQDILTKDNVNIKMTMVSSYQVTDPVKAHHHSEDYSTVFYNLAQITLRNLVGAVTIEELLEKKGEIDTQLLAAIQEKAQELGITVSMLAIKDIMLPANLKKAFSGILEAQKEAQRQLEKARGEQAVLRSLANTSNLYEANPTLLQARLVQTLSSGNNSIVFNTDNKPYRKDGAA